MAAAALLRLGLGRPPAALLLRPLALALLLFLLRSGRRPPLALPGRGHSREAEQAQYHVALAATPARSGTEAMLRLCWS